MIELMSLEGMAIGSNTAGDSVEPVVGEADERPGTSKTQRKFSSHEHKYSLDFVIKYFYIYLKESIVIMVVDRHLAQIQLYGLTLI